MSSRYLLEHIGRAGAGIVEEASHWKKVKVLNTFYMYVDPTDESITPCLERDGFWESWITAWVLNNVDENTLFLDIGANSGYFSFVAETRGAEVVAFEPNPVYFNLLHSSVGANDSKITISEYGVSDKAEKIKLHVPAKLHGGASFHKIARHYDTHDVEVWTTTLDDMQWVLPKKDNMVIKIDTEGHEEAVWNGMQEILEKYKPTVILEFTPGMYSDNFLTQLEEYAPLCWINYDGEAEAVTRDWIEGQPDWVMLVLDCGTREERSTETN